MATVSVTLIPIPPVQGENYIRVRSFSRVMVPVLVMVDPLDLMVIPSTAGPTLKIEHNIDLCER